MEARAKSHLLGLPLRDFRLRQLGFGDRGLFVRLLHALFVVEAADNAPVGRPQPSRISGACMSRNTRPSAPFTWRISSITPADLKPRSIWVAGEMVAE